MKPIRPKVNTSSTRRVLGLKLAPEVTGGDPAAVAEDQRLEKRIRELAITERETEREARSDELGEAQRRNRPGEKGGGRGRSG